MENHQIQAQHKWEGKASAKLPATTPGQAWSLLSDFYGADKWLSSIITCRRVDGAGVDGQQPGCVRYCAAPTGEGGEPAFWAKEELLAIDQKERSYSYKVIGNNMGIAGYVSKLSVVGDGEGCRIEWSFVADPVEGMSEEGLVSYLKTNLEGMARRVEEAVKVAAHVVSTDH